MRYTIDMTMTIDDEVRRATKLLETVMQAAGLTRKDLDQKLGAGPGYVSQVLTRQDGAEAAAHHRHSARPGRRSDGLLSDGCTRRTGRRRMRW